MIVLDTFTLLRIDTIVSASSKTQVCEGCEKENTQ
jgi:hypothetical protein